MPNSREINENKWWEELFIFWPQPLILGILLLTISFVPRSFSSSTVFSDFSSLGYEKINLNNLDGSLRLISRILAIVGAFVAIPHLIFFIQRFFWAKWRNNTLKELPLKCFERAKITFNYIWWFFLLMITIGTYLTLNDNFTKPGTYTALIGTTGQVIVSKISDKLDNRIKTLKENTIDSETELENIQVLIEN